jgi:hypothetical protein
MSFVSTQPEALTAAAGTWQGMSSAMSAQNAAAAAPTTGVVPAAADVNTLGTGAGSYAATEAANAIAAG